MVCEYQVRLIGWSEKNGYSYYESCGEFNGESGEEVPDAILIESCEELGWLGGGDEVVEPPVVEELYGKKKDVKGNLCPVY